MLSAARGLLFLAGQRAREAEGRGWENGTWADFFSGRRIEFQFQAAGAHHWLRERKNGVARGIYNRSAAGNRLSSKEILSAVQWRLAALV